MLKKFQIETVSAQGQDYSDVMKKLAETVNQICNNLYASHSEVTDIKYEQGVKFYNSSVQFICVTAFIHYLK